MTQLTPLNTCVLHHRYIYRISVCFSSRYNSEYETRNYIAYYDPRPVNVSKHMSITSWLYIQNFCMFHYRYNSEYQLEIILHTTTHGQLTSLNLCQLHHGYIYRISVCFSSRYNSEYETRNYIAYYDPVNVSKLMSITSRLYIQNFCMFHFQV